MRRVLVLEIAGCAGGGGSAGWAENHTRNVVVYTDAKLEREYMQEWLERSYVAYRAFFPDVDPGKVDAVWLKTAGLEQSMAANSQSEENAIEAPEIIEPPSLKISCARRRAATRSICRCRQGGNCSEKNLGEFSAMDDARKSKRCAPCATIFRADGLTMKAPANFSCICIM